MAGTVTASVVKNDTTSPPQFQNSAGTEIGQLCRAWVNFNGVTTATIRASFNVSSVTRNAAGDYTVNFTNSLPDANYSPVFGTINTDGSALPYVVGIKPGVAPTTSQIRVQSSVTNTLSASDVSQVHVAIFR